MQHMLLWVTILVLATSATSPPDPPIHHSPSQIYNPKELISKTNLEQVHRTVRFEPTAKTSSEIAVSRAKRASNAAFTELHDRISKLARVVNAVTLYNGLVDGSVPRDTAIAELMNVEANSLGHLQGFDKATVDGFITKLKGSVGKLSDRSKNLEKAITDVQTIREIYSKIKGRVRFPDKATLGPSMGGLNDLKSLDLSAFDGISSSNIKSSLQSSDDASISTLKTNLEKIATSAQSAMKQIDNKKILDVILSLESFHDYAHCLKIYEDAAYPLMGIPEQKELDDMKIAVDHLAQFQEGSSVSLMSSLINSRSATASIDKKVAAGFAEGYLDLRKLNSDLKDSWINASIGPHVSLEKVTALSGLQADMAALDAKWRSVSDIKIQQSLQTAAAIESKFGTFPSASRALNTTVVFLQMLPYYNIKGEAQVLLEKGTAIWKLKEKVLALSEISKISLQHSSDIAALNASDTTSLEPIKTLVKKIETQIDTIGSASKFTNVLTKLTEDILTFRKNPILNYTDYYSSETFLLDYFDEAVEKFDEVAASARCIVELRKSIADTEFYNNINKASTAIEQSKPLLIAVKKSFDDLKATPPTEMRQLNRLKGLDAYSKSLGDSATVLSLIDRAIGKKKALMEFVKDGHNVEDGAELLLQSSPGEDWEVKKKRRIAQSEVLMQWHRFHIARQMTLTLMGQLEDLYDAVKTPNNDSLAELGPILETFKGLPDVQLNVESRLLAVDQLVSTFKIAPAYTVGVEQELAALKQTLEDLQPLDLSFARYSSSLAGMSSTLVGISNVFANPAPAAPEVTSMKEKSTMTSSMGAVETKQNSFMDWFQYVLYTLAVLAVIAIVIGVFCFYKRKKDNLNTPEPIHPTPDPATAGTSTASIVNKHNDSKPLPTNPK